MFLFAHLGITLAAVKVGSVISDKLRATTATGEAKKTEPVPDGGETSKLLPKSPIDYRFLLLGAILPDLIDKPLGMVILGQQIGNGRIFSHTLLFVLILLHAGFILKGQGRRMFLSLFVGVSFHLVLDQMWLDPHTLLWPLYGWSFPKEAAMNVESSISMFLQRLFSNPALIGSEAIGGMLLLAVLLSLLNRKRLSRFVKVGDL